MPTVKTIYSVNDDIYRVHWTDWDIEKSIWHYSVEKYRIRSIAMSCNAKEEWKLSYRAQHLVDGKTTDYGFNFKESDVGDFVFTNYEDAKVRCDELNKRGVQKWD